MNNRVNMELTAHEKRFIVAYRKAQSGCKVAVEKILGLEVPCPQLRVLEPTTRKKTSRP